MTPDARHSATQGSHAARTAASTFPSWRLELMSPAVDATRALGFELGKLADPGWVVLLLGPLGAGKTVLAQGLLAGAGVQGRVASPTFTLINEYTGRLDAWHADLYRLEGPDEFEAIGGDELLPHPDGLTVIEWADRLGNLKPLEFVQIELDYATGDTRRISLTIQGERYRRAAQALGASAQRAADCPHGGAHR
jgi:tRNA threonylcarbamoyladenosine biosynthesis protein TsaE